MSIQKDDRPTIAYAISLIKCGDHQSNAAGMTDATLVLRHSIHKMHENSRYNYKMYAIVHRQAVECTDLLAQAGLEVVVRDPPLEVSEIRGEYLRKHIRREWCCGADEFVKLYAYSLPEPIVVHMDVDFVLNRPMDELFDVMFNPASESKNQIQLERPTDPWPTQVDAFLTKDWGQSVPGARPPGYQAGFLVARTNPKILDELVEIIREGNYIGGLSKRNGWGGLGYGGFVGAMAMQGLLAYYYDVVRPGTWMELNQCRYNHMGMDTLYRHNPNFLRRHSKVGKCRNNKEYCEDCQVTPIPDIYSIHYTQVSALVEMCIADDQCYSIAHKPLQCRKPWNCIGESIKNSTENANANVPDGSVILDHCLELQKVWHDHRADLEDQLRALGASTVDDSRAGSYKPHIFQGHCTANGGDNYLTIGGDRREEALQLAASLYAQA